MAEIETLTVVWDAKFDAMERKLNNVIRSNHAAADKITKAWAGVNDNMDRGFDKAGPGFASFKSGALAAAAGAAVATAAIGALTFAFTQARDAMKLGDDLQTTANRLQLTAEAVQELQFAAEETDVPVDQMTASLENLNNVIGKMKRNDASKGVKSAFAALGISSESLKDVQNANDLLPILADRLGQVRDTTQQVQIARRLGIEDLLPLLRQGSNGLSEMRDRARELGLVISNDTVKSLADANREMDLATKQIQASLTVAFSGLAVDIAKATTALAGWLVQLRGLIDQAPRAFAVLNALAQSAVMPIGASGRIQRALQPQPQDTVASMDAIRARFGVPVHPGSPAFQPRNVASGGGGRAARAAQPPRDTTEERTEQVNAALASAARDRLQAELALTVNVEDRAKIEKKILEQEGALATARLNKQLADLADDKGLSEAKKKELTARLTEAEASIARTQADRAALIDREMADKLDKQALELRQTDLEGQAALLEIQAELAKTAGQRREIELQLLDIADQRAKADLEALIASKEASDADKAIARKKLEQLNASRGGREAAVREGTQGPMESFLSGLPNTTDEFNERLEALAAGGISDVIDGLAQAAVGARDLGDVFRSVITQMALDLTRLNLQRALAGLVNGGQGGGGFGNILSSLFGGGGGLDATVQTLAFQNPFLFADGGVVRGPGTGRSDSVPAWLSNGEFVVNQQAASKNMSLLRALNAGLSIPPTMSRGGDDFSQTLHMSFVAAPGMSAAEARRTGSQAAAGAMERMAQARKRGLR